MKKYTDLYSERRGIQIGLAEGCDDMNLLLSAAFVLCWSSGFIGAKLGAGSAPAVTLLMWRFLPLAAVLSSWRPSSARAAWRGLTARDVARQAVIGALSQSGYLLTVYYAIQLGVSSGTTALIDGTQPLVAGALAGPLLHQYVSRRQWLGLCLGVSGVAVVTTADAAAGAGRGLVGLSRPVPRDVLAGGGHVPGEPLPHPGRPVGVDDRPLRHQRRPLHRPRRGHRLRASRPPRSRSGPAVGWLVVLSTFGGYGLYWLILRRSGVTEVNTLMFLMAPVTAAVGSRHVRRALRPADRRGAGPRPRGGRRRAPRRGTSGRGGHHRKPAPTCTRPHQRTSARTAS